MIGTLYGLGVGPGDPELLTVKAARVLRNVQVLAYPAPLEGPGMARDIVADYLPGGQAHVALRFAFTPGEDSTAVYDRGAEEIAMHLRRPRDVAFLCEGDPLLYGSFIGILERLSPDFPIRIVPGVSSLAACAAAVPMALTNGDEVLTVVPATRGMDAVEDALDGAETVAVIKIGGRWPALRTLLARRGLLNTAWLVERASTPTQQVRPAAEVGTDAAPYFSMLLIRTGRP